MIIEVNNKLLLLKRNGPVFPNTWNLPAGYVESDESPVQAARRESKEETGFDVQIDHFINIYFYDDDPRGNGIFLVYSGVVTGGKLKLGEENSTAGFFGPQDLPVTIAGGGHDQAIRAWKWQKND